MSRIKVIPWNGHGWPWMWSCTDANAPWHYSVDDRGFAQTWDEAMEEGLRHVDQFHSGTPKPVCGHRIRGRLSMVCNQLAGVTHICTYVSKGHHAFGPVLES